MAITGLPQDWETVLPERDGYCYLRLYAEGDRQKVAFHLGPYPRWADIKAFGGIRKGGRYLIRRRNDVVHITSDGAGYSHEYLRIEDDELIGGLGRTTGSLLPIVALLLLLVMPAESRRKFGVERVLTRLRQTHQIGNVEGFPELHRHYVASLDRDQPDNLCTADMDVRIGVVDLDWDDGAIDEYVRIMCPNVPDEWWVSVETAAMGVEVLSTYGDYLDSVLGVASYATRQALNRAGVAAKGAGSVLAGAVDVTVAHSIRSAEIATTVVNEAATIAEDTIAKAAVETLARASTTADAVIAIAAEVADEVGAHVNMAATEAISKASSTAGAAIDMTSKAADVVGERLEDVGGKVIERGNEAATAATDVMSETIEGLTEDVRSRSGAPAKAISEAFEAADVAARKLYRPKEVTEFGVEKALDLLQAIAPLLNIDVAAGDFANGVAAVMSDAAVGATSTYKSTKSVLEQVKDKSPPAEDIGEAVVEMAKDLSELPKQAIKAVNKENLRTLAETGANLVPGLMNTLPNAGRSAGATLGSVIGGFLDEIQGTNDNTGGWSDFFGGKKKNWWEVGIWTWFSLPIFGTGGGKWYQSLLSAMIGAGSMMALNRFIAKGHLGPTGETR